MTQSLFDLTGKNAIVTGGNGGIGRGIAEGLATAGANIAIWARNDQKAHDALDSLRDKGVTAKFYSVDVTRAQEREQAMTATLEDFGGVDILVANAGVNIRKRPENLSETEWNFTQDVNVTSVFETCKLLYPHMKARGGGKIITIGSMTTIFGLGISPAYAASKAAIVQLSKSLAVAWGQDNIQVNSLLPGWIATEMTEQSRGIPGLSEMVLARTPAGRWGNPSDLAGAAVFLASEASDFVTGTAIPIDGGFASTLFIVDAPGE